MTRTKHSPSTPDTSSSKLKSNKVLVKLQETPEERRKRRADKKQKKQEKREAKKREQEELLCGYTNEYNPFGDANLTEKFVWKLKREREVEKGLNPDEVSAERERIRRLDVKREIEKVKKRREQRELEKQQWEEDRARERRDADNKTYVDWEKKENEFHLSQARYRSEIRIREGRPKPIDILYKNLNLDADFDFEMNEPYRIFQGLSLPDLEELHHDIMMYLELDTHKDFWEALLVVCEDELPEARRRVEADKKGRSSDDRTQRFDTGIHQAVNPEIIAIFRTKTHDELVLLQEEISLKINSGSALDVEYWESILKKLTVMKAKAKLREIHAELLKSKLAQLQSQKAQAANQQDDSNNHSHSHVDPTVEKKLKEIEARVQRPSPPEEDIDTSSSKTSTSSANSRGNASPDQQSREEEEIIDADVAQEIQIQKRKETLERGALRLADRSLSLRLADRILTEDDMMKREAETVMEENEEPFNLEYPLENQVYWWHDKYRARKPRYFNRIHTGYEWNKYNQTHYDHDNPPPKIVQGYKFNIFYPDLIDKSKAPQYFIEKCPQGNDSAGGLGASNDTCILRFHAAPPYEDIAFKIVNKEWEYSHKKGFKCTFERGILHLWFNFRRYRYRR
eukprot:TRINITY_DN12474_c0_g1_i1.p1 TRINITY_DN12474_c0_g1~~TRINITY_DN12474_c0_g1_i1.p1  ORF type:complete len:626 (+),score=185.38 TRINITY_DN12474_c0_g1_i1:56-1933(+)